MAPQVLEASKRSSADSTNMGSWLISFHIDGLAWDWNVSINIGLMCRGRGSRHEGDKQISEGSEKSDLSRATRPNELTRTVLRRKLKVGLFDVDDPAVCIVTLAVEAPAKNKKNKPRLGDQRSRMRVFHIWKSGPGN